MYKYLVVMMVVFWLAACTTPSRNEEIQKVLLMPREGSHILEYMLTHEVKVMMSMLEESGFEVVVATTSGRPLIGKSITVEPDLRLADVDMAEYSGVIMPCMSAGIPGSVPEEAVEIVKEAVASGKPVAAQHGSVTILGVAGVLEGKQYTYKNDQFKEGKYMGYGVVQDGNIITSGTCPYMAIRPDRTDGTPELTLKLIQRLNSK